MFMVQNLKRMGFFQILEEIGAHGGVGNAQIFPIQVEGTDEYKWVMLLVLTLENLILMEKHLRSMNLCQRCKTTKSYGLITVETIMQVLLGQIYLS
jgi:hypothetical protein